MAKKGNQNTGGKKGRKIGRNAEKCARIRKGLGKKFSASKEHRNCGPLGYYTRKGLGKDQLPPA